MKKIALVTIVFLMIGMLFVPTLAKADSVVNITVEEKVAIIKLLMLSHRAIQIELDRPIVDTFVRDKSMSHKIEAIPGIKAADASGNRILLILDDSHNYNFTRLLGEISQVIMKHFGVDSIKFNLDK